MPEPYYADDWLTVHQGDSRAVLAEMPAESVTSPPYWGLRDYGEPGQLGLESTPEAYVEAMVAVFREVRRVLRSDGTVWLNLGDSYAGSWGAQSRCDHEWVPAEWDGDPERTAIVRVCNRCGAVDGAEGLSATQIRSHPKRNRTGSWVNGRSDLKPKDLVGIPWRVAFALQADGWYLRSDIIWSKPNPMPESVTDRPTKAHEYLFLLSKSPRYYFDADAVREDHARDWSNGKSGGTLAGRGKQMDVTKPGDPNYWNGHSQWERDAAPEPNPSGRNMRSVWTIATQPYPGAHFATFPRKLVEPCIKAGTSERGVCPTCGAPWERVVEREHRGATQGVRPDPRMKVVTGKALGSDTRGMPSYGGRPTGWRPTCAHVSPLRLAPAVVLDPFAGSGTTGLVAQSLSRRAVLIDLSMDYLDQLLERNRDIPLGLGA